MSGEPTPEQPTPKKQTETRRSKGGDSSGVPPSFRVATGLEDWPAAASPGTISDVFGIDFGEECTRVAGMVAGNPVLVPPKVLKSILLDPDGLGKFVRFKSDLRAQQSLKVRNMMLAPGKVVAAFFGQIYDILRYATTVQNPRVVVTVPGYYCSAERQWLCESVQESGFQVIGLLNDYAAACLSFVHKRPNRSGTILVVSTGFDTVSVAVLDAMSGSAFTRYSCTQSLSGQQGYDFWYGFCGIEPPIEQSRTVSNCVELLVRKTLEASRLTIDMVDFVLLSGVPTSNAAVRALICKYVPGRRVVCLNPDRANCFGAALHASVLAGMQISPSLQDILTQPIHLVSGDSVENIAAIGARLPHRGEVAFSPGPVAPSVMQSRLPLPFNMPPASRDSDAELSAITTDYAPNDGTFMSIPYTSDADTVSSAAQSAQQRLSVALDANGVIHECSLRSLVTTPREV